MKNYSVSTLGLAIICLLLVVSAMTFSYPETGTSLYERLEAKYVSMNTTSYSGMMIQALLDNEKNFTDKAFPVRKAFKLLNAAERPTFSILYGSYGRNPTNYYKLMDMLAETGKPVKVVIHILCGPCRSPRRGSPVSFAPWFTISQLNKAILKDARTQKRYLKRVTQIRKRLLEPYPKELYPQLTFVLVVELEDNLKGKSYKKFHKLTKQATRVVEDKINLVYMRNASYLSSPHKGRPRIKERHGNTKSRLDGLNPGDRLSLDGAPYKYPGESCGFDNSISYEATRKLIIEARKRNIDIELWRPEWQGLKCDAKNGGDKRKEGYAFKQAKLIKKLLK